MARQSPSPRAFATWRSGLIPREGKDITRQASVLAELAGVFD